MLAPNKQNLLLVKKQKKLITNGLKLLREKRTSLVILFFQQAKRGKQLEQQLSQDLQKVIDYYQLSTVFTSLLDLTNSLTPQQTMHLTVKRKRTFGVYLSQINLDLAIPVRPTLKLDIQASLAGFAKFFPLILEIAQLKLNCTRIAKEIEKTNRQISNLETRLENLKADEKFITTSLNEKQNLEKATLIKIFS